MTEKPRREPCAECGQPSVLGLGGGPRDPVEQRWLCLPHYEQTRRSHSARDRPDH